MSTAVVSMSSWGLAPAPPLASLPLLFFGLGLNPLTGVWVACLAAGLLLLLAAIQRRVATTTIPGRCPPPTRDAASLPEVIDDPSWTSTETPEESPSTSSPPAPPLEQETLAAALWEVQERAGHQAAIRLIWQLVEWRLTAEQDVPLHPWIPALPALLSAIRHRDPQYLSMIFSQPLLFFLEASDWLLLLEELQSLSMTTWPEIRLHHLLMHHLPETQLEESVQRTADGPFDDSIWRPALYWACMEKMVLRSPEACIPPLTQLIEHWPHSWMRALFLTPCDRRLRLQCMALEQLVAREAEAHLAEVSDWLISQEDDGCFSCLLYQAAVDEREDLLHYLLSERGRAFLPGQPLINTMGLMRAADRLQQGPLIEGIRRLAPQDHLDPWFQRMILYCERRGLRNAVSALLAPLPQHLRASLTLGRALVYGALPHAPVGNARSPHPITDPHPRHPDQSPLPHPSFDSLTLLSEPLITPMPTTAAHIGGTTGWDPLDRRLP